MISEPYGSAEADEQRVSGVWATLIVVLLLYVLPLIAIAIDELVLGTYWIASRFPDGSRAVFFHIYPFLRFLQ